MYGPVIVNYFIRKNRFFNDANLRIVWKKKDKMYQRC